MTKMKYSRTRESGLYYATITYRIFVLHQHILDSHLQKSVSAIVVHQSNSIGCHFKEPPPPPPTRIHHHFPSYRPSAVTWPSTAIPVLDLGRIRNQDICQFLHMVLANEYGAVIGVDLRGSDVGWGQIGRGTSSIPAAHSAIGRIGLCR